MACQKAIEAAEERFRHANSTHIRRRLFLAAINHGLREREAQFELTVNEEDSQSDQVYVENLKVLMA